MIPVRFVLVVSEDGHWAVAGNYCGTLQQAETEARNMVPSMGMQQITCHVVEVLAPRPGTTLRGELVHELQLREVVP